jgi:hypothetical protein
MKRILQLLLVVIVSLPLRSYAQNTAESNKPIEIGSHILQQEGNDTHSFKNGPYSYQNVLDFPGLSKEILFEKTKGWAVKTLKTAPETIFFDENKNSISVNAGFLFPDMSNTGKQIVEFKMILSFKENKIRIQLSDFEYHGYQQQTYNPIQMQFHKLKPLGKKHMQRLYDQFDEQLTSMQQSLIKAIKTTNDNW